jgi:hypothetical protein
VTKEKRLKKMPHVKNAHHSKQSSVKMRKTVTELNAVNLHVVLEKSLVLMVNAKDANLSPSLMKMEECAYHQFVEIEKRSNLMDLVKSVKKTLLYLQIKNPVSFQTANPMSTLKTMDHVPDVSLTPLLLKTD